MRLKPSTPSLNLFVSSITAIENYVLLILFFTCNTLHSPEHLTVNQGVTGSSPVGGVEKGAIASFFFCIVGVTGSMSSEYASIFGGVEKDAIASFFFCIVGVTGLMSSEYASIFGGVEKGAIASFFFCESAAFK